jgi:hypothetical protein
LAPSGGWESCRNLLGGSDSFGGTREFNPNHAFRRRRWFRSRATDHDCIGTDSDSSLLGGFQAFHQPLRDSFSRVQQKVAMQRKRANLGENGTDHEKDKPDEEDLMKISIKNGDGIWSAPAFLPPAGTSHGVIRVLASRWPTLTKLSGAAKHASKDHASVRSRGMSFAGTTEVPSHEFRAASLSPDLMELCYTVSDVEGDWGEFSRSMVVSPRFLVRNDSKTLYIEVKQTGSSDEKAIKLAPGEAQPFYWADFRLPALASVRPTPPNSASGYKWSGGFDVCNLGMAPVRVRKLSKKSETLDVRSMRANVEIRPGTGGTGINVSFREEDSSGDGSLFRIENLSTFPIWLAQDGVLANPLAASITPVPRAASVHGSEEDDSQGWNDNHAEIHGDLLRPLGKMSYALDIPYRQGKYAHRKAATMPELLRLRVALAPLGSRAGIESVKVISLTNVGDSVRLNPSKLVNALTTEMRARLERVRVLGVITNDGPTRVLKFW